MNYLMKKAVNHNCQDMMLTPLEIDFAHRIISLADDIEEDVATVMNSALRCLARDSEDDITIYIQSRGGSVSAGFSIYDTIKALSVMLSPLPVVWRQAWQHFYWPQPERKANVGASLMLEFLSISHLAERMVRLQIFAPTPNTSSKRVKSSPGFSPSVPGSPPRRLRLTLRETTS